MASSCISVSHEQPLLRVRKLCRFELRFVGGKGLGDISLPQGLGKDKALLFQGLLYQQFYGVMQDALGMLTAFPLGEFADRYYSEAASSSVATAISLGEQAVG